MAQVRRGVHRALSPLMTAWGGRSAAETFGPNASEPSPENMARLAAVADLIEPPPPLWADIERPPLIYRTLADIDDAPAGELILGMYEDGPNLAYSAPGVGKGSTMCWVIVELQKLGMKVCIYDAERRPREW